MARITPSAEHASKQYVYVNRDGIEVPQEVETGENEPKRVRYTEKTSTPLRALCADGALRRARCCPSDD